MTLPATLPQTFAPKLPGPLEHSVIEFLRNLACAFPNIEFSLLLYLKPQWFQWLGVSSQVVYPMYKGLNKHIKWIENKPLIKPPLARTVTSLNQLWPGKGYILGFPGLKQAALPIWLLIGNSSETAPSKKALNKIKFRFTDFCIEASGQLHAEWEHLRHSHHKQVLNTTSLAHQIKTPLNSLEKSLETLQKQGAYKSNTLIACETRLKNTNAFLREFLNLQKQSQLGHTSVDLTRLFGDIKDFFRFEPMMKNVCLNISPVPADVMKSIRGNKTLLFQVLQNLICNAARELDHRGAINIYTQPGPSGTSFKNRIIKIEVEDTGPGIQYSERERVFNAFYNKANENGVGLYICRQIMNHHKGEIHYTPRTENRYGFFTLSLPLHQRPAHDN